MFPNFVPAEHASLLDDSLHPAPFLHETLSETSGNARKALTNGFKPRPGDRRAGTPDSLDDLLPSDADEDEDDFVVDDDGAGYALGINGNSKRTNDHLDDIDGFSTKRRPGYHAWQPTLHKSFQPGSTPWRGSRRYLCRTFITSYLPKLTSS